MQMSTAYVSELPTYRGSGGNTLRESNANVHISKYILVEARVLQVLTISKHALVIVVSSNTLIHSF